MDLTVEVSVVESDLQCSKVSAQGEKRSKPCVLADIFRGQNVVDSTLEIRFPFRRYRAAEKIDASPELTCAP